MQQIQKSTKQGKRSEKQTNSKEYLVYPQQFPIPHPPTPTHKMSPTTRSKAKFQEPQPSTSTVAPVPNLYPFGTYHILKRIELLASRADLAKLKGINSNYYATLKPVQVDVAGKKIIIKKPCPYYPSQHLVHDEEKKIHRLHWKSGFGQVCKEVEINSLLFLGSEPDGPGRKYYNRPQLAYAQSVINDLCPYITTVRLNQIEIGNIQLQEPSALINVPETGVMIAEFLNKFVNLKQLELTIWDTFSQSELEDLLTRITQHSRTKITLKILYVKFNDVPILERIPVDNILALSTNINLQLNFSFIHIHSDIVTIYKLHGARIVGIDLDLGWCQQFPNDQNVTCLDQLCLIVTDLKISYKCEELHIFGSGIEWPNLRSLSIDSYHRPLVILKHCPQLENLEFIYINQPRCIFHNPNQTAQEDIREYFGNLKQLKTLTVIGEGVDPRAIAIKRGNKLHDFLKTVLPKRVRIIFEKHRKL